MTINNKNKYRTAIITGSSDGIGLATAATLSAEHCNIVLVARDRTKLENAAKKLRDNHQGNIDRQYIFEGDMTDADSRCELVTSSIRKFGSVDILVNNVGGGTANKFIEDINDEDLIRTLDLNLVSAFSLTRLVVPYMKEKQFGRIVNVASTAGRNVGRLSGSQYAAAKAGMIGMSRHLAFELGRDGITVNNVAPGATETARALKKFAELSKANRENLLKSQAIPRFGKPEEVAAAICFLCSENSGFITGACIDINGGAFFA